METDTVSSRTRDVLLFIFSLVAILSLACGSLTLLVSGMVSANFLLAAGTFFCLILLIPLFIMNLQKLNGKELQSAKIPILKWQVLLPLIISWVIIIVISSFLSHLKILGQYLAFPLFLLGMVVPIVVLTWTAGERLPTGSWRRLWASFCISMTLSIFIAVLLEGALLLVGAVIAAVFVASNPALLALFQRLSAQLSNGGNLNSLLPILTPYLTNPFLLISVFIYVSILAPLIEETVKPLAVWLLGKRLRSPAEGFALGALCGAGFALLEGMIASGGNVQILGIGVAERAASTLVHITTSGLMGWGIASARLEKRYGRMVLVLLLSVTIHGSWNGGAIFAAYGSLLQTLPAGDPTHLGLLFEYFGLFVLGVLLVFLLTLLPLMNRRLRPKNQVENAVVRSDIIAPPQP